MNLEGFQVVSSLFWALLCTGLTGRGHRSDRLECWYYAHVGHRSDRGGYRSDRCELKLLQLPCFHVVCMHSSMGRWIGSGGACCVQGELFVVVRALVCWFALFA
jgi:hypothetical protein